MGLQEFKQKIKRQETPFYAQLYKVAKAIRGIKMPVMGPLHRLLYQEWAARTSMWHNFWRVVYYEPMFKSMCAEVGRNFSMHYAGNGTTRIAGNPRIVIGDNVTIFDNTVFVGLKILDEPEIQIGDDSYIGPGVRLMAAKRISIGRNCIFGGRVLLSDNSGHPISDVMGRMDSGGGSPSLKSIHPISVGDFCFITNGCCLFAGAEVGDGVVAKMGAQIKGKIPPFVIISGNPCKVVGKLPIPPEIEEVVGRERYEAYLAAHETVVVEEE